MQKELIDRDLLTRSDLQLTDQREIFSWIPSRFDEPIRRPIRVILIVSSNEMI